MPIEGTLKDKVKKLLKERGAWYYMPVPMGYGRKGIPDFVACHQGFFLGIETKSLRGKKPEPWQEKELKAIIEAKGGAIWIREIGDLENYLDELDKNYLKMAIDNLINVPHIGG